MRGKTVLLGTAFAVQLALGSAAMAGDEPIGKVIQQEPSSAIDIPALGGGERPLAYQAAVYANDIVATKDTGTQLQFTDETLLTVSSNSKFKLDSFVFQKNTGTLSGNISLGVGVFRLVTGALVKHDNLDVTTPVSVLSIRGTDFVAAVDRDGSTLVRLYEGRIRIKTCNGSYIWLHAGQRITIAPSCVVVMQNVGTGAVVNVANSNDGGDGNGVGGDPPGGGGGDPSGADPSGGGGNGNGNDPGTGNGGNGTGNGGVSPGNGHDPGSGNGHGPSNH
jgi:hypothetical protein